MYSFLLSIVVLIIGFLVYSKITEKIFGPDERETPAYAINDGVDCVPMKTLHAFLIQLLNIAGTGPIFGALMGACFGPVVFLWIVLGAIFAGAVHDYMSGMISERHEGQSIAQLSGIYIGGWAQTLMRVFSILLLVLTGTVFVTSPATLLSDLTPDAYTKGFWIAVILLYYVLATILPIDKVIGWVYPIFGFIIFIMAVGIAGGIILTPGYTIPEITFKDLHPEGLPVWPFMFVTVACGAISGFHSTQSPMMAKCIQTEKAGRYVFYGAMILESVIALIWAAAGVAFYGSTQILYNALSDLGQSGTVYEICHGLLGNIGGVLAVVGVIACPITSGDTAFRSIRLITAEWSGIDQRPLQNRLVLTIPLLSFAAILTQVDFNILWRYFSWSNQTLAMISLWVATSYLIRKCSYRWGSLLTAIPATFMTAVSATFILMADEGFGISARVAYPVGIIVALIHFFVYIRSSQRFLNSKKLIK